MPKIIAKQTIIATDVSSLEFIKIEKISGGDTKIKLDNMLSDTVIELRLDKANALALAKAINALYP